MSEPHAIVEQRDQVMIVTLDRPEPRNAPRPRAFAEKRKPVDKGR
jgi:enoyl-CoA hydratase/carnithine racemase